MNHTNLDTEAFQYNHIFNLLRDIFEFNEIKDGDFVKDTLKILLEFEKNGETIVEVDKRLILFEEISINFLFNNFLPIDTLIIRNIPSLTFNAKEESI